MLCPDPWRIDSDGPLEGARRIISQPQRNASGDSIGSDGRFGWAPRWLSQIGASPVPNWGPRCVVLQGGRHWGLSKKQNQRKPEADLEATTSNKCHNSSLVHRYLSTQLANHAPRKRYLAVAQINVPKWHLGKLNQRLEAAVCPHTHLKKATVPPDGFTQLAAHLYAPAHHEKPPLLPPDTTLASGEGCPPRTRARCGPTRGIEPKQGVGIT